MEIGFFLMYRASSDGEISWDEARFISEIIGLELTPRKIAEIIKEKNIYSTEFESTPPVNFSIVVGLEKQYGEHFYPEVVPTEIMLSVYRTTDGADAAIDDFQTFISMLENCHDRELRDTPIDESPVRVPPKNTGSAPPQIQMLS